MTRDEQIKEIMEENNCIKRKIGLQNTMLNALRGTDPSLEEVYKKGYEDAEKEQRVSMEISYHNGMNAVWDAIKKIALNREDGGLNKEDHFKIFGHNSVYSIIQDYTPKEVVSKIAEYEEHKHRTGIGDEVVLNHDDTKAVVMDESDQEDAWWVYTENGCVEEWHYSKFCKTGRTFPQIEEVLKAMQENES